MSVKTRVMCTRYMHVAFLSHKVVKLLLHQTSVKCYMYINQQRIAQSTRRGGPDRLKRERFTEALYDEEANLTFTALTGRRKHSIHDVEILFSSSVADFMTRNGYDFEAHYVSVIRNWRCACDERGLSQLQRCRFSYQLLNMILDELMPWHMISLWLK